MGYGLSGRIKEVSLDRKMITLRTPLYLEVGVPYICTFTLNDGSKINVSITDIEPGYNNKISFASPLPLLIADKATFSLAADGIIGLPRPFRVTKVEEMDGSPDTFTIEAININRNKWYDADNLTDSGVIQYSALPSPMNPPGPTSCSFVERFVKTAKQFQLIVSPTFNRGAYKYYANDHSFEVWSRPAGTTETFIKREVILGDTLIDHPPGLYEFKVLGKSYLGYTTDINSAQTYSFNVTNPKDPPKDVDWARINDREVYWGYANAPDDFAGFIVRYHNQVNRTTWDDAAQPHQGLLSVTSFYTSLIPPSARVIMVRAVDAYGIVSENSATIFRELGDVKTTNIVDTISFEPAWIGNKIGGSVVSGRLEANDTGTRFYSGTPTALIYTGATNFYNSTYEQLVYEASFTLAEKGNMLVNIDFDGAGYQILTRKQGEVAWNPVPTRASFDAGNYELQLTVFGGAIRGVIRSLELVLDADEITEDVEDLAVLSTGTRVPLTKTFGTIRIVSVIIQDNGGDQATAPVGYRIFDKNPTLGPLIKLVNSEGTYVSGLVDVVVRGF